MSADGGSSTGSSKIPERNSVKFQDGDAPESPTRRSVQFKDEPDSEVHEEVPKKRPLDRANTEPIPGTASAGISSIAKTKSKLAATRKLKPTRSFADLSDSEIQEHKEIVTKSNRGSNLSIGSVGSSNSSATGDTEEEDDPEMETWFSLPIFAKCSRDFVKQVWKTAKTEVIEPKEILIAEEDECIELIIVHKGILLQTVKGTVSENSYERPVNEGDCVSALGVLGLCTRNIAALNSSEAPVELKRVSQEALIMACGDWPADAKAIRKFAADLQASFCTLKHVSIFENCGIRASPDHEPFFWLLSEQVQRLHLSRGECIVNEGEEGHEMFILESGEASAEVSVTKAFSGQHLMPDQGLQKFRRPTAGKKGHGQQSILQNDKEDVVEMGKLAPGAVFGELAMMGISNKRSATVRVTSAVALALEVHKDVLMRLLLLFPNEHQLFLEHVEELAMQHMKGLSKEAKISDAPPFKRCNPEFCKVLQESCERRVILPKTLLLQEGAPGGSVVYVVQQGKLDVELLGKPVGSIAEGECFGEATMLGICSKNTASIRTNTLVSVLMLHREAFDRALYCFPQERKYFESMTQMRMLKSRVGPEAHSFFRDCEANFVQSIRGSLQMEIFMPDQHIVKEGDVGTSMFILSAGKAFATVKTTQVAEYESGAIFGELTLLGIASRRTATVTAGTVCVVEVLHQHAFETILEQYPSEKRHFEELARSHLGHCCDYSIYSWPFFKDCPSRFLYLLDINLERCVYFAGEKIVEVNPDDTCNPSSCALSMYVLLRGHAIVTENGETLVELNDGDVYGEMAVLGVANEATKILSAYSMCDMHVLSKAVVDQAFREFPDELLRFQDRLAAHITENEKVKHGTGGRALRRTSLFRDTTADFLQHLWGKLETKLYMPEVVIVEEGQQSSPCMYILRRGNAAVYVRGVKVKEYQPGDCFGEIGILGFASQRTATIVAVTPVVVQILHREDFVKSLGEYPENSPCFDQLRALAEGHLESYLRRTVSHLPVFANSDPVFLDEICEFLEERTFGPGDLVVHESKPMTHQVMLLVSGKLVVTSGGILTGELTPGELAIFGEISTLGVGRWTPATVHCSNEGPCMVVVLHRVSLEKVLEDYPEEKKKFAEIDQMRLRRDSSKLADHRAWIENTAAQLKEKVTFFQNCSGALLYELVKNLTESVRPPNSMLAEDRSASDSMVVLLDGIADVLVNDVRLGKLGPGAVFGEENVLGFPRRTASLKARSACRILSVPSSILWDLLSDKTFERDHKFFAELREHRAICALSLQKLPIFKRCDPLCLQQVALHANHVGIQRGQTWEPGKDVKHQGEAFAVFVEGSASLELEGFEVATLGPGSAFAEGLVHRHGGIVAANERCSLYSFRRHDLLAAVLHFPKAQGWFSHFRKEQNSEFDGLKHLLVSKKARVEAFKPHPKDEDIRQWAYKQVVFRHRTKRSKSEITDAMRMSCP